MRFDAITGAPAGVSGQAADAIFIASGSGGLDNPSRIVFGPDGRAYVSSTAGVGSSSTTNSVLRYNSTTAPWRASLVNQGDAVFVPPPLWQWRSGRPGSDGFPAG